MCLALVLYHFDWLRDFLTPNHVFLISSHCHCTLEVAEYRPRVVITYLWNDSVHAFSGIPLQVALLQQIALVREQQSHLVDDLVNEVTTILQRFNTNQLSEQNLMNILEDFRRRITEQLQLERNNNVGVVAGIPELDEVNNLIENGRTYIRHCY
jgi:hypothetical protein